MNVKRIALLQRMEKYPHLEARLEALLNLAENTSGEYDRADDAEGRLIIEMRNLGQEMLQEWANNQSIRKSEVVKNQQMTRHTKKNFTGKQPLE
jgi:hypothetical protein